MTLKNRKMRNISVVVVVFALIWIIENVPIDAGNAHNSSETDDSISENTITMQIKDTNISQGIAEEQISVSEIPLRENCTQECDYDEPLQNSGSKKPESGLGPNDIQNDRNEWGLDQKDIKTLEKIVQSITDDNMNRADKIKAVYDWIVSNVSYDYLHGKSDAHRALNEKNVTCNGYSELFNAFMDVMGIPCLKIIGTVSGYAEDIKHAWNACQLEDGYWYYVDTCWGDAPIDESSDYTDSRNVDYRYFLACAATMGRDHTPENNRPSPEADSDVYRNTVLKPRMIANKTEYYKNLGMQVLVFTNKDDYVDYASCIETDTEYVIIMDNEYIDSCELQARNADYVRRRGESMRQELVCGDDIDLIFCKRYPFRFSRKSIDNYLDYYNGLGYEVCLFEDMDEIYAEKAKNKYTSRVLIVY